MLPEQTSAHVKENKTTEKCISWNGWSQVTDISNGKKKTAGETLESKDHREVTTLRSVMTAPLDMANKRSDI